MTIKHSSIALLLTVGLGAQAPTAVVRATPPPSRDGAYSIPRAQPRAEAPLQTPVQAPPVTPGMGRGYALDTESGEVAPSGDDTFQGSPEGRMLMAEPAMQARQARLKAEASAPVPVSAAEQALLKNLKESEDRSKRLEEAMRRQEVRDDKLFGARDSKQTDASLDVEFAEATASRRASTLAREKGYSLVPAMRTIRMRLRTMADSEQSGGKVKATILEDVWDATHSSIAIPAGSLARLYVEGATGDSDTRIRLTVTEFQLPGGDTIGLRVPDAVTDEIGATGPLATVDHRWGTRFVAATGYAVVSALSAIGAKSSNATNASFDDVLRNNLSGQFGSQAANSFTTGMQAKPVMRLNEGAIVEMTLGTNLYLVPWQRVRPIIPVPRLLLGNR